MRRIIVIGSGGAGKSTLARELGQTLGLRVIHLDTLFWRPGWVQAPTDEFDRVLAAALRDDAWIIDGNYRRTLEIRLDAADTVIFLDFPRLVCLWRVLKRRLQHAGRARPDMAPGCPEKIDWEFLRWIWSFPSRNRSAILEALTRVAPNKEVIVLRKARTVSGFLARVKGTEREALHHG